VARTHGIECPPFVMVADPIGVHRDELVRVRDEQSVCLELVVDDGSVPPGALALHDHLLRVLDRALVGTSYRGEVQRLIEAADEIDRWRLEKSCPLSTGSRRIRERTVAVLRRLAAVLPDAPPLATGPHDEAARPVGATTMTVEAFAHAIGKSPRTVYRMVQRGQLLVRRDGVGRGTVLIYQDQVELANRPGRSSRDDR